MAKDPKPRSEATIKKEWEIPENRMDRFTIKEGDLEFLDENGNPLTAAQAKARRDAYHAGKKAQDQTLGEMAGVKPGGGAPGGIMPEEE